MTVVPTVVPFVAMLGPFEVSVALLPSSSRLILSAEYRQVERFFRLEITEGQIPSLTKGLCHSCQQLFDLLSQIIGFLPMDPDKYRLKLTETGDRVDINVIYVVFLEPTPRQYDMTFQLLNINDVKRLETKMNDQTRLWTDCFQYVAGLTIHGDDQRNERAARFDPATTPQLVRTDHVSLSDHRTVATPTQHVSNSILTIGSHPFHIPNNQRNAIVSFATHVPFLTRENTFPTILVGVFWQHSTDRLDITAPLEYEHAWWFSVHSGRILNVCLGCRDYARPVEEFDCVRERPPPYRHRVDILLDTITRCVAFRVDGHDTGTWAFTLPHNAQIDQLYPIIFLKGDGYSLAIDP